MGEDNCTTPVSGIIFAESNPEKTLFLKLRTLVKFSTVEKFSKEIELNREEKMCQLSQRLWHLSDESHKDG